MLTPAPASSPSVYAPVLALPFPFSFVFVLNVGRASVFTLSPFLFPAGIFGDCLSLCSGLFLNNASLFFFFFFASSASPMVSVC